MIQVEEFVRLLPYYEADSKIYKAIFTGACAIFNHVESLIDDVEINSFISTAEDRLEVFSKEIGLVLGNVAIEDKREIIRSHYWAMRGVVQEKDIKKVCKAYTNGDIEIVKDKLHGRYVFKFISIIGKPKQIDKLNDVLKRMIHAGYTWQFEFKYNTWNDIKHLTWDEAKKFTWNGLREEDTNG